MSNMKNCVLIQRYEINIHIQTLIVLIQNPVRNEIENFEFMQRIMCVLYITSYYCVLWLITIISYYGYWLARGMVHLQGIFRDTTGKFITNYTSSNVSKKNGNKENGFLKCSTKNVLKSHIRIGKQCIPHNYMPTN